MRAARNPINIERILEPLNPPQREAVAHLFGPLLVFAGAGTGKTRVITHRIAYLIEYGVARPDQILALTFTNKAAREMKLRAEALIGPAAADVELRTFHSFGALLLRRHVDAIPPFRPGFSIFDESDRESLIKKCIKELGLPKDDPTPKKYIEYISKSKNALVSVSSLTEWESDFQQKLMRVYELYEKKLQESNAFDFDDLILKCVELMSLDRGVAGRIQDRYPFIMVDEYQDTNQAQFQFLKLLAGKAKNVGVVGDDDQSIYGWRGADISNIRNFQTAFGECKTVKLEQNYRSRQSILTAANGVIRNNPDHQGKNLWTERGEGDPVVFYEAQDEREEMGFALEEIKTLQREAGARPGDFGILFRTRAQSRVVEEYFLHSGLPHRIVGGIRFYDRMEVKDLLAYLKFLVNPQDRIAFSRLANTPKRGVGPKKLEKLLDLMTRDGEAFLECGGPETEGLYPKEIRALFASLRELRGMMSVVPVDEIIRETIDRSGMRQALESAGDGESLNRLENLSEFVSVAIEHGRQFGEGFTLDDFLARVSLYTDVDDLGEDDDFVSILTLHSTKGLEFKYVFVLGFEENLLPHITSIDQGDIQEERRLCYVGMTRAKERLYLVCATSRLLYGRTQTNQASRFRDEIPPEVLEERTPMYDPFAYQPSRKFSMPRRPIGEGRQSAFDADDYMDQPFDENYDDDFGGEREPLKVGDAVRHREFGRGVIVSMSGGIVEIDFQYSGRKKLSTVYAVLYPA